MERRDREGEGEVREGKGSRNIPIDSCLSPIHFGLKCTKTRLALSSADPGAGKGRSGEKERKVERTKEKGERSGPAEGGSREGREEKSRRAGGQLI